MIGTAATTTMIPDWRKLRYRKVATDALPAYATLSQPKESTKLRSCKRSLRLRRGTIVTSTVLSTK